MANKNYKTFQDQLFDSNDFKKLAILYGKYPEGRIEIEKQLHNTFAKYSLQYSDVATKQLKLMAIPIDITYHSRITMETS